LHEPSNFLLVERALSRLPPLMLAASLVLSAARARIQSSSTWRSTTLPPEPSRAQTLLHEEMDD